MQIPKAMVGAGSCLSPVYISDRSTVDLGTRKGLKSEAHPVPLGALVKKK